MACLLSGFSGCSNPGSRTNFRTKNEGVRGTIEIDGNKFVYVAETVVFDDLPPASFVAVCKVSSFVYRYENQLSTFSIFDADRLIARFELKNDKSVVSLFFGEGNHRQKMPPDTVLFVDANEIVSSKSFQELGITVSEKAPFIQENLQPILERMIRENLPKEDTETE